MRRMIFSWLACAVLSCNTLPDDPPDRTGRDLIDQNSMGTVDTGQESLAAQQEYDRKRREYLNTKYEGERGQAYEPKRTLYAAIIDIYNTAKGDVFPPADNLPGGPFSSEHVTALYRDKYDYNYYWAPRRGVYDADQNTWSTGWRWPDDFPKRPELQGPWGTVHNHIRGKGPESPIDGNGENPLPDWIVTDDGSIFVYPPNARSPKAFGRIDKGQIITAYNNLDDALNPGFDVYADGGSGGGCGFWCWAAIILGGSTGGGYATAALVGMASTTGEGCCFGPPASGYDPNADPTQICRHPDGNGDCT
jgi:hypothetical protein